MRPSLLAAVAASLALGACATYELSNPRASETYVATAAANDLFAIQAAELALSQAEREDVRAYAQRLIEEHGRASQHLANAAAEAGMSAPSAGLTSAQQRVLGDLQGAPAGAFDEVYLREEIPAHEAAIKLHSAYALTGDAAPLRRTAAMANARVHQHLVDAERMLRMVEAGTS